MTAFFPISQMIKHREVEYIGQSDPAGEQLSWNFNLGSLEAESVPLADARLPPKEKEKEGLRTCQLQDEHPAKGLREEKVKDGDFLKKESQEKPFFFFF